MLGTSVDAVRKHIGRGSLASEKGEDGRVYVWLEPDQDEDQPEASQGPARGDPQTRVDAGELVEELRRQNEYLREQLDAEREARTEERRRSDTLIARLMDRLPELEPPAEPEAPQDATRTTHEEAGRVEDQRSLRDRERARIDAPGGGGYSVADDDGRRQQGG